MKALLIYQAISIMPTYLRDLPVEERRARIHSVVYTMTSQEGMVGNTSLIEEVVRKLEFIYGCERQGE